MVLNRVGHWPVHEAIERVIAALLDFLALVRAG